MPDARTFRFAQVELPWPLGPPDGRYLLRDGGASGDDPDDPTHVIVFVTLGAPERRRRIASRRSRPAQPEPEPTAVATGRATVIDVAAPLAGADEGDAWMRDAGEPELEAAVHVLNRALHAFRVVSADPYLQPVGRRQALVARLGYGAGEQVADGRWTAARDLSAPEDRGGRRRTRILNPQARLAAVLGGRERPLACEELILRARADLDHDRWREAALQLLVALDAAIAELPADERASALAERVDELRGQREPAAGAAQSALSRALTHGEQRAVEHAVGRVEAALRARAAANG